LQRQLLRRESPAAMKIRWKQVASLLLAGIMAWWVFGCAAVSNLAAPPAPLSELPSSLQFPSSIKVDTPELNVSAPASPLKFEEIKDAVLPIGGEFFDAIHYGFQINDGTDAAVGAVLGDLHQLSIPFNPITRTFQQSGGLGGIFLGATIKIDFADYDFDGNGTTVGCTGCTCPTGCDTACPTAAPFADLKPVCYRIWLDATGTGNFTRLMAGFFTQLPIEDDPSTPENEQNPGAGKYRERLEFGATPVTPPISVTNVGADYNHRDPDHVFDKKTDYFLDNVSSTSVPNATMNFASVYQTALQGATNANQVMKSVQYSVNQEDSSDPNLDSTLQYIARYRTDIDPEFWSGTLQNHLVFPLEAFQVPPAIDDFTGVCAQLETAIGVADGTCIDLGIDVTHVPFLDLLASTDPRVNLPADFPATPTF